MPRNEPSAAASNMFGRTETRFTVEFDVPFFLVNTAHLGIGDMPVPGELMRERTHVAGALHVVLTLSGFTPTPSRPMLPVAMARFAMAMTIVDP